MEKSAEEIPEELHEEREKVVFKGYHKIEKKVRIGENKEQHIIRMPISISDVLGVEKGDYFKFVIEYPQVDPKTKPEPKLGFEIIKKEDEKEGKTRA